MMQSESDEVADRPMTADEIEAMCEEDGIPCLVTTRAEQIAALIAMYGPRDSNTSEE